MLCDVSKEKVSFVLTRMGSCTSGHKEHLPFTVSCLLYLGRQGERGEFIHDMATHICHNRVKKLSLRVKQLLNSKGFVRCQEKVS